MVLADSALRQLVLTDGLIAPYNVSQINPASINLRLGREFIYPPSQRVLHKTEGEELDILSGQLVLGRTEEYIRMPEDLVGMLCLRSTWARKGLDHALAGWVDPGYCGVLTLELSSKLSSISVRVGEPIVQLVVMKLDGRCEKPYSGKYQYDWTVSAAK